MNKTVDNYLINGCERCSLGGTPQCKVLNWSKELSLLRKLVLDCGVEEEAKWGVPCYMFQGKNILVVSASKDYCSISFFKGSLLSDSQNILEQPGKNSQAYRLIKFTDTEQVIENESDIKTYIFEAIEVEKAGLEVDFKKILFFLVWNRSKTNN